MKMMHIIILFIFLVVLSSFTYADGFSDTDLVHKWNFASDSTDQVDDYTITLWVKPNSCTPASNQHIIYAEGQGDTSEEHIKFRLSTAGVFEMQYTDYAWSSSISGQCSTGWQFIAISYNKANGDGCIYHNNTKSCDTSVNEYPEFDDLVLGSRYGGTEFFDGAIDEVNFFDVTLSDDNISTIFADQLIGLDIGENETEEPPEYNGTISCTECLNQTINCSADYPVNSTGFRICKMEDVKMILGSLIIAPMVLGVMFLLGSFFLGKDHEILKIALFLLAPITFWVSLQFGTIALINLYNMPGLVDVIGRVTFITGSVYFVILTYFVIYMFYKLTEYIAEKKKAKLNY
jgi:hypothetical protein